MNISIRLEQEEGYTVAYLSGQISLREGVDWVTATLTLAREQNIKYLLIDAHAISGFPSPDLSTRYHLVREWARAARSSVRLAVVLPRYLIDERKFGISVANSAGLRSDVFDSKRDALEWLLKPLERELLPTR